MQITDPISALQGQIQAISMTLTAVISALDPATVARAGIALEIERATLKSEEENDPVEHAEVRDLLLDAMRGLMQAAVTRN